MNSFVLEKVKTDKKDKYGNELYEWYLVKENQEHLKTYLTTLSEGDSDELLLESGELGILRAGWNNLRSAFFNMGPLDEFVEHALFDMANVAEAISALTEESIEESEGSCESCECSCEAEIDEEMDEVNDGEKYEN